MPEQLNELMEYKKKDAVKALDDKFGGVKGLCLKLGVDPFEGTLKPAQCNAESHY